MNPSLSLHTFERFLWTLLKVVVPVLVVLGFVRFFVFSIAVVDGPSMLPTLHDGTLLGINRIGLLWGELSRGDLIQAIDPRSHHLVVKRVIGLPGETLTIKQGKVFVSNEGIAEYELDESAYLVKEKADTKPGVGSPLGLQKIVAGPNEYIVLGDNRTNSGDSRHYGALKRSKIIGTVFKIF